MNANQPFALDLAAQEADRPHANLDWCIQHARHYVDWVAAFATELSPDQTLCVVVPEQCEPDWQYAFINGLAMRMPRAWQVVPTPDAVDGPWVLCADPLMAPMPNDTLWLEYGDYFTADAQGRQMAVDWQGQTDDPDLLRLLRMYYQGATRQWVHVPMMAWHWAKALKQSGHVGLVLASGVGCSEWQELRITQGSLNDEGSPDINFHAWQRLLADEGWDGDLVSCHDYTVSAVHWWGVNDDAHERLQYRLCQQQTDDVWPLGESLHTVLSRAPSRCDDVRRRAHFTQRLVQAYRLTPPSVERQESFQLTFSWLAEHHVWPEADDLLNHYVHFYGDDEFYQAARRHCEWHTGHHDPVATCASGELVLQRLSQHHAPAVWRQYQDPGIHLMTRLPELDSLQATRLWVQQQNEEGRRSFAVVHREHGFVGVVSVRFDAERGYFYFWMGQEFQGRGFAKRAANLLLEQTRVLGLEQLYTSVYQDNFRSRRVLESMGCRLIDCACQAPDDDMVFYHQNVDAPEPQDHHQTLSKFLRAIESPIRLMPKGVSHE